jgi:hypothetical protein
MVKQSLDYIPFVSLDVDNIIKVETTIVKHEIYVVNSKSVIKRLISYRRGMESTFAIESKIINNSVIKIGDEEFPNTCGDEFILKMYENHKFKIL